jgi:hypothetical protein
LITIKLAFADWPQIFGDAKMTTDMLDRLTLQGPLTKRDQADLAVVIIGLGAPPELPAAVHSILEQSEPIEIVVVNSCGGGAAGLLAGAGIDVPVIESRERLFAGAARNTGIERTRAPFVAFLASDCLAAPGWAAERLRLHRDGVRMVASAMMPHPSDRIVAWAHHLLLFPRRLPGLPAGEALRYGVSFDRRLFDEVGLFDGGLATGEDTELLDRLAGTSEPVWTPNVITYHRNATGLAMLVAEQIARGRRYGQAMRRLRGIAPLKLAKLTLRQPRHAKRLAEQGLTGRDLKLALKSLPLVRIGCYAKALGILASATSVTDARPPSGRR